MDQESSKKEKWKKEMADSFNKLSKLLTLECKPEKQEKIKAYIQKCLSCFYLLILGEKHVSGDLSEDLKNCLSKL